MTHRDVRYEDLGLKDYKEVWDYQEQLFHETIAVKMANRKEDKEDPTQHHILFCEHPHVYTLGKSGSELNLLVHEEELKRRNATFYKINRGGDITYHGPGQLVVYPILDLDHFFTDIHKYLRLLEEAVIQTLAHFNIEATRVEGLTGVWLLANESKPTRKICAMGVKCSRWVTMHGIALNIATDLSYFSAIVPCGIQDKAVTSMHQELEHPPQLEEVKTVLKAQLKEVFEFDWIVD